MSALETGHLQTGGLVGSGEIEQRALHKTIERHISSIREREEMEEQFAKLREHFAQVLGLDGAVVNFPNISAGGTSESPRQDSVPVHFNLAGTLVIRNMVVVGGSSTDVVV